MTDKDALMAAIHSSPGEETPRLVFADWLDDHGIDGSEWRTNDLPLSYGDGGDGDGGDGGYGDGDGDGGYGDGDGGDGGYGYGYGDGDGDGGYGDGDGGDGGYGYGYGDGDGGDGIVKYKPRRRVMPAIGDKLFLHAQGSFYPYVWVGIVSEIIGPDHWVLTDAAQLPNSGSNSLAWLGIASGDKTLRRQMRVRMSKQPIEVFAIRFCTPWVGELPTQDQN